MRERCMQRLEARACSHNNHNRSPRARIDGSDP